MGIVIPIRARIVFGLLLLCPMWLVKPISALDPAKSFSQYKQIVWDSEKGLPQSLILSMVQARDGYLWLGTQEGLVRFNGSSFKVFDTKNTPTLKSNLITSLFEDRTGRLWVGTNKGLHLYQDGEFTIYTTENGLAKNNISALYEDRQGNLWIGTSDVLNRFKEGRITTFDANSGFLVGRIRSIAEAENGDIWIGGSEGLVRWRDSQFKVITANDGLSERSVRVVYRDAKNDLLIGTDAGLFRLDAERFISDPRFTGKLVRTVRDDMAGALWVGGGFGVSRIVGGSMATMESRKDIPSGTYAMFEDAEGSFWIGTESEGLLQFVDGKFAAYTKADGLLDDVSYAIYQDEQKDIWITNQKGISRFRDHAFDLQLTSQNGLPNTRLSSIVSDGEENLWIGTAKGLLRWQKDRLVDVKGIQTLSKKIIQSLYRDPEGVVWIGTNEGLSMYDSRSESREIVGYSQPEGLGRASVFAITGSISKGLWLGTGRGLFYLKDGQLTTYSVKDGLENDVVVSLYEDEAGVMWIGTFGGGLSRFKDNRLATVNVRSGLFNDIVYAILPDDHANLWMSCNRGIFRVSKSSIDDFLDGKRDKVDSIGYGMADGMKSAEANGGFQPAGLRAQDGKLWFPTVKGVVVIDPENITTNLRPPPVYVENMIADSIAVSVTEPKTLSAGTQRLQFEYSALSFVAPERVNYKYRLEGYDKDWISAGNRHEAFYTNLPPGDYTFQVIASNNDGVWNESGSKFAFRINPYMYQTWWFAVIVAILVGVLIFAVDFWRVKALKLRQDAILNERYRIARELHDTLLQGFVGVSSQLSVVSAELQTTPEIAGRHLNIARKMIRHSVTEARLAIQNLRAIENDHQTFPEQLRKTLNRITEVSSINSEIEIIGTPFIIPSEVAQQLLLIVEEAVVNTIKHANARTVKIILTYDVPGVRLEVIDDGKGFDPNVAFSPQDGHFGMIGMQERAEKAKGKLKIERLDTGGTRVVFDSRKALKIGKADSKS